MKTRIHSTLLLAVLCGTSFAETLTVDNKPGAVAMYADFASAVAAAAPGDTLLLAGSPTSYGTHTLYKRLNIVGPGYFLGENGVAGSDNHAARITLFLRRKIGVDSSGYALSGVHLEGLEASTWSDPDADGLSSLPPSVTLKRCLCYDTSLEGLSRIDQCFFNNSTYISGNDSIATNSYFYSLSSYRNKAGQNMSFENCVFENIANSSSGQESNAFNSCIFKNSAPAIGSISYSIVCSGTLPSGTGNQGPFAYGTVFKQFSRGWDLKCELAEGSPAEGAGFGGTDAGIFGGARPYVLSGLPNRPRITQLIVPSTVTEGTGLPFQVTAEGH